MAHRETMTSRERVLTALNHETPDRVPIDLGGNQTGIHKFAYAQLLEHLGIRDEVAIMDAVQQLARPCEAVLERFHVDTRYIAARGPESFEGGIVQNTPRRPAVARPDRRVRRRLVDARRSAVLHGHLPSSAGRRHARRPGGLSVPQGRRSRPVRRPARAGASGSAARRPTPWSAASAAWSTRSAGTCAGWSSGSWTCSSNPEFCEALLDRTLEFWLDWFRAFLDEVGDLVDVIMIGDDLAGQTGPLFRPEFYRRIVKPRQKRLVQYIRA